MTAYLTVGIPMLKKSIIIKSVMAISLWTIACGSYAGEKVALLIANAKYEDMARLEKPYDDVKLIENSLLTLGFKKENIKTLRDIDQRDMKRAFKDFGTQSENAEIAFFYYSGHGLQHQGSNYLVPVQAQISKDSDIDIESVSAQNLLAQLEKAKLSVLVLDACRDNPWLRKKGVAGKGLARMETPNRSIIAFATNENNTAADQGLYAQYLSQYLVQGLELRKVFDKVGAAIDKETGGKQQPRVYSGVYDDVYLNGKANPTTPVVMPSVDPQAYELSYWESIKNSTNASDYAAYLADYPRGRFASLAKSRQKQYEVKPTPEPVQVAQIQTREQPRTTYGVGQSFKDCAECPEMVLVPSGSFMMGSKDYSNEKPVHEVTINDSFAVGKYEVTFAQWDACVADGGCGGYRPDDAGWGRGTRPVMTVNWEDAQAYLRWLSQKTGQKYRLLSESEWEYVARAGSSTDYSWGNDIGSNKANCDGCGGQWDAKKTAPVGSFSANKFGLYDVHGNVWEWVEDCWHGSYEGAPTNGSAWLSSCTEERRVLRGGSWVSYPDGTRSANRNRNAPTLRNSYFGFRVSRSL